MIRSSVVLPEPDGPSSAHSSPSWMSSETSFSTRVVPKARLRFRMSTFMTGSFSHQCRASSRAKRHSNNALTASVSSADKASSEATAKAGWKL